MAIFIVMALSWLSLPAQNVVSMHRQAESEDSLTVSLITCFPGPEIYELCGHEAIRVRGEGRDSVWNYGVFDFREPNFVYRFVKGETDYIGAGYPFAWFMPEYVSRGSKVVEQDLNLTQEEAHRLLAILQESTLPQNRKYRYNYVLDNCATRISDKIDKAVTDGRVIYPDTMSFGTFRKEMRTYHHDYPWYQFGIDLALGSGIDRMLRSRDEMFVPVEMMKKSSGAHFTDGRPLVRTERVLYEGLPDATLGPTPWYQGPIFWSIVTFLILSGVCVYDIRKMQITRFAYSIWFTVLGLAGIVISFLVFVSEHEATSPNVLIVWLNPIQLLFGVSVWWRKLKIFNVIVAYCNVIALTCLLAVWPFQSQSANIAFFPLMFATLALSATYAIISPKVSYKNGITSLKLVAKGRKTAAAARKTRDYIKKDILK